VPPLLDNEKPAHKVWLEDFSIDRAPVSNGEYLEFINDGGYKDFCWWHSAGWEKVNTEHWQAPLYWEQHDTEWMIRDFAGLHRASDKANEPVYHVSFLKRRLTQNGWGSVCRLKRVGEGRDVLLFAKFKTGFSLGRYRAGWVERKSFENGLWSVAPTEHSGRSSAYGCQQMIGDVWEWTTSDYVPYPGFKSEFDEYNDKWFVGQKVLRGGSFATPRIHIRSTYRNFFHPKSVG